MTLFMRMSCCILVGLAVLLIVLGLASVPVPPSPRLGHRGAARYRALESNGLFASLESTIRFIAGLVGRVPLGSFREQQDIELRRAGNFLGLTADEYLALSLLSALGLGGTVSALCYATGMQSSLFVPGAVLGFILPKLHVQGVIRERAKTVGRGLPHSIEIAALCMGAGLDFPGSIRMLVSANRSASNALTEEFEKILEELELGHTRKQALLGFADRVRTPAVRDFVNAVIQAEQKGNPLAKVIQVQGRMLNMRRSVAAEEAAARAGVLMIGPMVLLLGCILLLLMGPFMVKGIGF